MENVEVEGRRVDAALRHILAIERASLLGIPQGDAPACVAGQPLGEQQGGERLAGPGGAIYGDLQGGFERLRSLEGGHGYGPLVRVWEECPRPHAGGVRLLGLGPDEL